MAIVSRFVRQRALTDPLSQARRCLASSLDRKDFDSILDNVTGRRNCTGFGSSVAPDFRWRYEKYRPAQHHEDATPVKWSHSPILSRSFGTTPALKHWAVSLPSHQRSFRRSLFLKSSPEHAARQYLEAPDEGIVVISLNRSEAKNAIGAEMLKQLHSMMAGMRYSTQARALLVLSTVPGVFCAGADLKERRKMGISETEKFVGTLRATFSALEALPIPTIAVIEGAALGGGLELALACDLRVCGEEAIFGLPETSLAIIPGAGGTQRLPRVIGRSKAKELIFTARRIDAQHAESIGLVDHCVQAGEAYNKAISIAREILSQGPLAVQVAKHAIDHGSEMDQAKGMLFEEACYSRLLNSRDRLEGLAAFAEKRKPVYHGE
ncbi:hypothetical protein R1sor_004676 [Riccia sorocarpa]|uniref:Methylglutaconyl-CoA hydratase n=1 Tax=Riccia sorocarpa TaxID=122646 RepID=A0ABD3HLQ6_9MARC